MQTRTFLYTDARSNKFWTIAISADGKSHTVTYGKTGTTGQTITKDFPSAEACRKAADKLIAEKTGKGYVEQNGSGGTSVPPVDSKTKSAHTAPASQLVPAGSGVPPRPANVPDSARWLPEGKKWKDFDNSKNRNGLGDVKTWAADGILLEFTSFKKDKGYTLIYYHSDGTIAQQTEYKGMFATQHGTFIDQRADNPNPAVKFPSPAPEVWKIVRTFKDGDRTSSIYYDRAGNQLDREKIIARLTPQPAATAAAPQPLPQPKNIQPEDIKPWPKNVSVKKIPFNEALPIMPRCVVKYVKNPNHSALFVQGDVHLKNDLVLDEYYLGKYAAILVQGNVTIEGNLQHASGESSEPVLIITGNLEVETLLYGETDIAIGGNLTAKKAILGFWEGDLRVAGKISTPALHAPDHNIEATGKKFNDRKVILTDEDFLPKYYDEDGNLDLIEVRDAVGSSKSIFQKSTSKKRTE